MTRFKFRLAPVQRLREETRDHARQELARAVQAEQILAERIDDLNQEIQALVEQVRQGQRQGQVEVDRILDLRRYELILKVQRAEITQNRNEVEQEVERRRQLLAEADREVRVLEQLKENQQTEWQRNEERAEQKSLDEIASLQHFRGDAMRGSQS